MKQLNRIAYSLLLGAFAIGAANAQQPVKVQREARDMSKLVKTQLSGNEISASAAIAAGKLLPQKRDAAAKYRGNIQGACISFDGMTSTSQSYWGQIDIAKGSGIPMWRNGLFRNAGEDYDMQTSAVRNNIVHIPEISMDYVTSSYSISWKRFDLKSGTPLSSINFNPNSNPDHRMAFCYSLTYDPIEDVFYGLSYDVLTETMGTLVKINPNNWNIEEIGDAGSSETNFIGNIVYCQSDDQLYGTRLQGDLVTVNKRNAQTHHVVDIDNPLACPPAFRYGQSLAYSPYDKAFVTLAPDGSDMKFKLLFIDAETGHVTTACSMVDDEYFVSLYCADPFAVDTAPDIPVVTSIAFEKASLSGAATVQFPENTYGGTKISGNMTATIELDGNKLFSGTAAPGEKKTVVIETTDGKHTLTASCYLIQDEMSPELSADFFVGNDVPKAPTALRYNEGTLTWSAPDAVGVNDGYVDITALTYDVYYNNRKQNTAPISGTSYQLPQPESLQSTNITVTASANGKTSAASSAITEILGPALELPISLKPTSAEQRLFTVYDANHDGSVFYCSRNDESATDNYLEWKFTDLLFGPADDWLFLPVLNFADAEKLYRLNYDYRGYLPYEGNYENLDICIGKAPKPESMTTNIYHQEKQENYAWESREVLFAVPNSGNYYIGFHYYGGDGSGILMRNFKVNVHSNSAMVPADPTNVKVTANKQGQLEADVTLTAPTLTMNGKELNKDEAIKFNLVCGKNTATLTAKPGETVSGKVSAGVNDWTFVNITPSNTVGSGATRQHRVYVGLDVPLAPGNIKGVPSDDNLTMLLTWDTPTGGQNGGYINPDDLTYMIKSNDGESAAYVRWGSTTENQFVFNPLLTKMTYWGVGPSAVNAKGESIGSLYVTENLGTPYEVPITEEFTADYVMGPWKYMTDSRFDESIWEYVTDLSLLGIGTNATLGAGAGILCRSLSMTKTVIGEFIVPKVSTLDLQKVVFSVRYLDFYTPQGSAVPFEIWGRRAGHLEAELLKSFTPERPVMSGWVDAEFELPEEYQNCPWVELRIRPTIEVPINNYLIIDNLKYYQNVDTDLKVNSIEAPDQSMVGDVATCLVTVMNAGTTRITDAELNINVYGDGELIANRKYDSSYFNLRPGMPMGFEMGLHALQGYDKYNDLSIEAVVTCDGDEVAPNNKRTKSWKVIKSDFPVVTDLKAKYNNDNTEVALNWSEPDLSFGSYESFEYDEPFILTDQIGRFQNLDLDHEYPFAIQGLRWENDDVPIAWQTINTDDLGVTYDPRLYPKTGSQYVMARSISYDELTEEPTQSQDWLISPEVVGGTTLGFWYNTINQGYAEYVYLYESSTTDDPKSFTYTRSFSKSGEEDWEYCEVTLKPTTKYFALVYSSIGALGAMLDDISYTPKELLKWELAYYNLYTYQQPDASDYQAVGKELTETSFAHKLADQNAKYWVTTYVKDENGKIHSGPKSNIASIYSSGVDDIVMLSGVTGGRGQITFSGHAGKQAAVYTADGKIANVINLTSDNHSEPMNAGVYLVKIGNSVVKLIVK